MDYTDKFYTQFLYKTNTLDKKSEIDRIFFESGMSNNVLIEDLSQMEKDECIAELNSIIASERIRFYYPGDPQYILRIIKTNVNEYFFVLSVCGQYLKSHRKNIDYICSTLFNCLPEKCMPPIPSTSITNRVAINYWSDLFNNLNSDDFKGIKRGKSELNMATFRVDDNLKDAFSKYVDQGGSGSALCATVLGQMSSHMLDSNKVIVNQILTGTPLSCAPIILHRTSNYGMSLDETISQFESFRSHCFCKREDLYQAIGNRFINRIMISTGYADSSMYSGILNLMKKKVCYIQHGIDTLDSPLCVYTRRFDDEMTIVYYYDDKTFEFIDMENFHNEVCKLFKKALDVKDDEVVQVEVENITATESDIDGTKLSRADQLRFDIIKKLTAFNKYTDKEIINLLKDATFVLKNSKQYIFNRGEKMDRVYFICVGRVQVMGVDSKDFINPLFIAKHDDVFGVEALTQKPELRNIYKAYSEDVVLMSISKDVLIKESHRHPEILEYILSKQLDISTRFQNLWLKM